MWRTSKLVKNVIFLIKIGSFCTGTPFNAPGFVKVDTSLEYHTLDKYVFRARKSRSTVAIKSSSSRVYSLNLKSSSQYYRECYSHRVMQISLVRFGINHHFRKRTLRKILDVYCSRMNIRYRRL